MRLSVLDSPRCLDALGFLEISERIWVFERNTGNLSAKHFIYHMAIRYHRYIEGTNSDTGWTRSWTYKSRQSVAVNWIVPSNQESRGNENWHLRVASRASLVNGYPLSAIFPRGLNWPTSSSKFRKTQKGKLICHGEKGVRLVQVGLAMLKGCKWVNSAKRRFCKSFLQLH